MVWIIRTALLIAPLFTYAAIRGFDFAALASDLERARPGLTTIDVADALPTADPAQLPPAADNPEAPRWIFYTSGTTSDPKGAQHSDANVLLSSRGLAEALDLGPTARTGVVFPVTHLGGANALVSTLFAGSTQLVVESFDPATTIPFLADHGVTHAGAGPVFYQAYLEAQRAAGPRRPPAASAHFPHLGCHFAVKKI